jgi:hypothetical protein
VALRPCGRGHLTPLATLRSVGRSRGGRASAWDVRSRRPTVRIERLQVQFLADDDNGWFTRSNEIEVQIDTQPGGRPPFLIEGNLLGHRRETSDVSEAVELILRRLGSP